MFFVGYSYARVLDVMIALGPEFHAEVVDAEPQLRREIITQHIFLYADVFWWDIARRLPTAYRQRPYLAILNEQRGLLLDDAESAVPVVADLEASVAEPVCKEMNL